MAQRLFEVKTQCYEDGMPSVDYTLVMARSMTHAVNKVEKELEKHSENESLYDAELQKEIARGNISDEDVDRKYSDYVRRREYIK